MKEKPAKVAFLLGMLFIIIGFVLPMYYGEQLIRGINPFLPPEERIANLNGFKFMKYWHGAPKAFVVTLFVVAILGFIVPLCIKVKKINLFTKIAFEFLILLSFIGFTVTLEDTFNNRLIYTFEFEQLSFGFYLCGIGVLLSFFNTIYAISHTKGIEKKNMEENSKSIKNSQPDDIEESLTKLKSLLEKGLISEEEFATKKASLLGI